MVFVRIGRLFGPRPRCLLWYWFDVRKDLASDLAPREEGRMHVGVHCTGANGLQYFREFSRGDSL